MNFSGIKKKLLKTISPKKKKQLMQKSGDILWKEAAQKLKKRKKKQIKRWGKHIYFSWEDQMTKDQRKALKDGMEEFVKMDDWYTERGM